MHFYDAASRLTVQIGRSMGKIFLDVRDDVSSGRHSYSRVAMGCGWLDGPGLQVRRGLGIILVKHKNGDFFLDHDDTACIRHAASRVLFHGPGGSRTIGACPLQWQDSQCREVCSQTRASDSIPLRLWLLSRNATSPRLRISASPYTGHPLMLAANLHQGVPDAIPDMKADDARSQKARAL